MSDSFLENPKDTERGRAVPVVIRKDNSEEKTLHNSDLRARVTSRAHIHNQTIRKVEPAVKPSEKVVNNETPVQIMEQKQEREVKAVASKSQVSQTRFYVTLGLLVLVLFAGAGSSLFFYQKSKIKPTEAQTADSDTELRRAIASIGSLAVLPQNDEPVLVLVSDPVQLQADPFFDQSQVGDQVLIYPRVGRAYLYRPSTKQIVNITSFVPGGAEDAAISQSPGDDGLNETTPKNNE